MVLGGTLVLGSELGAVLGWPLGDALGDVLGIVLGVEDGLELELGKELGMVLGNGVEQELEPKDALVAKVKGATLAVNVPSWRLTENVPHP
jgi:hypothetical protein